MAEAQPIQLASRLDTFLFDLGGVQVDDLDLNYATSIRIFKTLGKRHVTREEYVANLMPIQKLYEIVGLNREESAQSIALFKRLLSENLDSIKIQPDAETTLQMLKDKKVRLGLVTQYSRAVAGQILAKFGIAPLFDTVVGFEDSEEQKPSPKPVLTALARLGSRSECSVFVGDMKQDIIAGHNAGVRTVGVFRGKDAYHTRDVLREANPGLIIENLNELIQLVL